MNVLKPSRVYVIAMHTFTQLVRMKVFYFLAIFAVVAIGINFLDLPQYNGPEAAMEGELQMLKSTCLGVMKLFAIVFAISATALLLPKDLEDRTLYTILAKPVPRLDYLAGKYLGVILLIAVAIFIMDLLMTGILTWRAQMLISLTREQMSAQGLSEDAISRYVQDIKMQGATWWLQGGIVAIMLQSAVVAAIALLLSTFSSSTLFTIAASFILFMAGHFQADALDYYSTSQNAVGECGLWVTKLFQLVFPNFQLFNISDAAIAGLPVPLMSVLTLSGLSFVYIVIYIILGWYVFSDKEF